MQKTFLTLSLFLICFAAAGQYYTDPAFGVQENRLFSKYKVKFQVIEGPVKTYVEYDFLGREIKTFQENSTDTTFVHYYHRGDTLIQHQYSQSPGYNKRNITVSKFLYTKKRRLRFMSYVRSTGLPGDADYYFVLLQKFSKSGLPVRSESYHNNTYPYRASDTFPETGTDLVPDMLITFYYNTKKRVTSTISKTGASGISEKTSYFYDRYSRLIKTISYSPEGYLIERMVFNLVKTVTYTYGRNYSVLTTTSQYREFKGGPKKTINNGFTKTETFENGLVKSITQSSGPGFTFTTNYSYTF